jgi:hypothetical protein
MWNRFGEEKGAVLVLFALIFVFLLGLVAIVVDAGLIYLSRGQLQKAADAASIAGAYKLPDVVDADGTVRRFVEANGIQAPDQVSIMFPGRQVQVRIRRDVPLFFAPVLGVKTMRVNAEATAALTADRAFNFALFSGGENQDLNYSGSSLYVEGDCHSNRNSKFSGSSMIITGIMDVVGNFHRYGSSINIGDIAENSDYIPMPDFSDSVRESAVTYYGNTHKFGSTVNVNGNIVVEGDAQFSGSTIRGVGTVMAKNNIQFNGSSIRYESTDDAVVIYSENGDIQINGSNIEIHGILYAPNGRVRLFGSSITVYGSVVAKEIQLAGSSWKFIYDPDATQSLPNSVVRLIK